MASTQEIRQWARALPEVSETNHFRFAVPIFKVRGRTFVGIGTNETTAVFCISEAEAEARAAESSGSSWCVRRMDEMRTRLQMTRVRFELRGARR